ncbi:serine hydrolase [Chamaesiphon sp. GL140_3_metabinner_50]|uniref:serine hydrolase n=1 Tax=Chamaesiphon sp. GL140_3_metabinner_50 TaxID=2970812 RepID=UPI0025DAC8FA|nr:serine hydrolase [Chamaesiphon sp. GL140_3_metabinner_50]
MAPNSSSAQRRSQPKRHSKKPRQQRLHPMNRSVSASIQIIRLIICGLGASTIAGTTISIVNPPKSIVATKIEPPLPPLPQIEPLTPQLSSTKLHDRLQIANNKNSKILDASYLFIDLDRGEYSEWGADRVLPAASTITLPIAIALFEDVDTQKIGLTEKLTLTKNAIASGAGDLKEQKIGTQVSVLVAITKMITINDNTATNLLIERLGGKFALNQRFRNWGLIVTTIERPLPDLEGKNVTTARELTRSMMAIRRGKIISDASRSQILSMMSNTTFNTMLPSGLAPGTKIAHKSGDIGAIVADVGAIELSSGKKYLAAVLVKRPYNDPTAPELVRQMSEIAAEYFQTSAPKPTPIYPSKPQPQSTSKFPNTIFIKNKN